MTDAMPLVLVIEDEPQMRKFMHPALELQDYRVVEATSAAEGTRRKLEPGPARPRYRLSEPGVGCLLKADS